MWRTSAANPRVATVGLATLGRHASHRFTTGTHLLILTHLFPLPPTPKINQFEASHHAILIGLRGPQNDQ